MAKILFDQGAKPGSAEFQRALDSALLAVRIKPDLLPARDLLASLYLKSGQNALAVQQCRLALQTNPSDQSALYHLIMALRNNGQEGEVQGLVKRWVALQHDSRGPEEIKRYKLVEQDQATQQ